MRQLDPVSLLYHLSPTPTLLDIVAHVSLTATLTAPTFAHRENFLEANDGRFGFALQGDRIGLANGALRRSKTGRREHELMRVHADTIGGHLRRQADQ